MPLSSHTNNGGSVCWNCSVLDEFGVSWPSFSAAASVCLDVEANAFFGGGGKILCEVWGMKQRTPPMHLLSRDGERKRDGTDYRDQV